MTATLLLVAVAIVVAPVRDSRVRLEAYAIRAGRRQRHVPWTYAASLLVVAVGWCMGGTWAGCAMILACGTALLRHRQAKSRALRDASLEQLLAALEILIAELRVGAHPAAAGAVAADECTGEVRSVFRAAAARARLGGSAATAFARQGSSIEKELARIASVWGVADVHGLALAELLGAVRVDMLGRKRFRQRTEAGLAGARASAAVLACLPLLGIGLGQLMGASPVRVLLGGGLGGVLLTVGTGCVALGLLWTDKITARAAA